MLIIYMYTRIFIYNIYYNVVKYQINRILTIIKYQINTLYIVASNK